MRGLENKMQRIKKMSKQNTNYRENNKDKIKEMGKVYYEKNKEHINLKRLEKIECVCGSCIRKSDKAIHERSKKHQNYMDSLQSDLG